MNSIETDYSVFHASAGLKLLYSLALLSIIPISLVGSTGWVALATGSSPASSIISVLVFFFCLWRIFDVWRCKTTLDAPIRDQYILFIRRVGLVMMIISVAFVLITILQKLFVFQLVPRTSENGIEFFVVGVWLSTLGGAVSKGVLLFEASRLIGFERQMHEATETQSHRNDASDNSSHETRWITVLYKVVLIGCLGVSALWGLAGGIFGLLWMGVTFIIFGSRVYSVFKYPVGFVSWNAGLPLALRKLAILVLLLSVGAFFVNWLSMLSTVLSHGAISTLMIRIDRWLIQIAASISWTYVLFDFSRLIGYERERLITGNEA